MTYHTVPESHWIHVKMLTLQNSVSNLSGRSLAWTCSPVWGSVGTGCVWANRGHSPQRTGSGSERTDCGWCAAETPAWWSSWTETSSSCWHWETKQLTQRPCLTYTQSDVWYNTAVCLTCPVPPWSLSSYYVSPSWTFDPSSEQGRPLWTCSQTEWQQWTL